MNDGSHLLFQKRGAACTFLDIMSMGESCPIFLNDDQWRVMKVEYHNFKQPKTMESNLIQCHGATHSTELKDPDPG